jgi:hypothetical protein
MISLSPLTYGSFGMNIKKCKPLGSAMEEFVFGTKEALPAPTPPFALLPVATPHQPEASAPDPVPIQSKEFSMMSKLQQALDKEATVRFTVGTSKTLHCQNGENENE